MMINNLDLQNRIKNNWYSILITIAFFITLLNYFELKTENERLTNQSVDLKGNVDEITQEKENLEYENEDLKSQNEDNE